jgi:hypothetical protein
MELRFINLIGASATQQQELSGNHNLINEQLVIFTNYPQRTRTSKKQNLNRIKLVVSSRIELLSNV